MPFEIMDQRGLSASSHFFEDGRFCPERNGLLKPRDVHDLPGTARMGESPGGMSPRGIFGSSSPVVRTDMQPLQINPPRELTAKQFLGGEEGFRNTFKCQNNSLLQHLKSCSNGMTPPTSFSYGLGGAKIVTDAGSHESSLFSSSLSEIFTSKMWLSANDVLAHQPAHTIVSNNEEGSCEYHRKNEAEHIGSLLPDEDDLFCGVIDDLGYNAEANTGTDLDDFDLFSSGGGLELEEDNVLISEKRSDFGGQDCRGGINGKLQLGEQLSRSLFVRNIDSNIEDAEVTVLFEQFGDIRNLYTAYKHHGFVMVSYYDLRASQDAMRALQNKPLRHRKLDIHYSIPNDNYPEKDINHGILAVSDLDLSVSNDELEHIFGFYGEIKNIYEISGKHEVKFIEFYDVRSSDAALEALSGSKIAGRHIKLEQCGPDNVTSLMQHSQRGKDGHNIAATSGTNAQMCLDTGHQGLYSSMGQIMNAYTGSSLLNGNQKASLVNTLPTPVGRASAGKLVGVPETRCFVDGVKATSVQRFHAHSLPEYRDTVANGFISISPSNTMNFASNTGSRLAEGIDGFGSPGNGNYPLQGLHYMLNKSNLRHQHPSHMMWQNSPPLVNGACTPHLPQMSGFPRVPPHMLRASHINHHVGSAPVVNGSPWDRRLIHLGESMEGSSGHLGSLGNAGYPGTWQLNPANMSPQNMFSHVGGNPMDMTANAGQSSSKEICHLFPGRNPMMSMSKHDATSERTKNMYHRRGDSNTSNADKKQFQLDVESIVRGKDSRTTLMIKNIPNKYTSKMLLAAIDEQCRGTYDFIYLPIDFKNKCNVGYAFINMIDPSQILPFYQAFNGKKWEKFNSEKVASLAYARIQGKAALIAHFQNSSLMNEDKRCRPILFHTDGPNAGDPEPFPIGTNIRYRPGKYRSSANEEYGIQGNPSTATGGDKSSNAMDSSVTSD